MRRKYKPYDKMTWQEKRDLEILDEIRDDQKFRRAMAKSMLPKTKNGRIKRGCTARDYRPRAPRVTTDDLVERNKMCKDYVRSSPSKGDKGAGEEEGQDGSSESDLEIDGEKLDDMGTMSFTEENNVDEVVKLRRTIELQEDTIDRLRKQVDEGRKQLVIARETIAQLEVRISKGAAKRKGK